MPAVAPYVAATTAGLDGPVALHLGEHRFAASLTDGSVSLDVPGAGTLRSRRFHRAEEPTGLGVSPDRHPRDGLEPRVGRVGRPGPARPAGGRERHRPAGRHPRRGRPGGDAGRAPRRRRHRRTVRPAGAARHPLRHRRGRPPGPGRGRAVADARRRPGPGSSTPPTPASGASTPTPSRSRTPPTCSSAGPTGRGSSATTPPTSCAPTAAGWWRPARGATSRPRRPARDGVRRRGCGSPSPRRDADLLRGVHVLDTRELPLPVDGLDSIATWDPHLVRRDGEWLVGFVSARRFFDFHPAVAAGPTLDDLRLLGAAGDRTSTEGTTLRRRRRPDGGPRQRRAGLPTRPRAPASRRTT